MIKQLIQLANELDKRGLTKEANHLDKIIKAAACGPSEHYERRTEREMNQTADDELYYLENLLNMHEDIHTEEDEENEARDFTDN
jgi:hypothetical protein